MPSIPWVDAIKARTRPLIEELELGDDAILTPDKVAYALDVSRLLRAVEVLGEALEKSAARVFEPDEFADEDEGWTCEECGGSWITPSEEAHAEWCTVGVARRALADVREG